MLSSIHPLGERARHNRWHVTATAYTVGSAAGGALVGATAGTVGRLLNVSTRPTTITITITVLLLVAAAEVIAPGRRWPGPRRQVNEDWLLRYRGWVYGGGFGFQLGTGIATQITTTAIYGWILLAALTTNPATGLLIGAVFGIARAAPIVLVRNVERPEQLRAFHARFHRYQGQ